MVNGCDEAADQATVLTGKSLGAVQPSAILLALWKMAGNDSKFEVHRLDFQGPCFRGTYEEHVRVVGQLIQNRRQPAAAGGRRLEPD